MIQNPAAFTTTRERRNPAAVAFYDFMFSRAGPGHLGHQNFRATNPYAVKHLNSVFYQPKSLVTVGKLGGWGKVTDKFFSPGGIITNIESAHGYTS